MQHIHQGQITNLQALAEHEFFEQRSALHASEASHQLTRSVLLQELATQNAQATAVQQLAIANVSDVRLAAMDMVSNSIFTEKAVLQQEAALTIQSIENSAQEAIQQQQGLSAEQLQ